MGAHVRQKAKHDSKRSKSPYRKIPNDWHKLGQPKQSVKKPRLKTRPRLIRGIFRGWSQRLSLESAWMMDVASMSKNRGSIADHIYYHSTENLRLAAMNNMNGGESQTLMGISITTIAIGLETSLVTTIHKSEPQSRR
jgi:hypothetical protein